MIQFAASGIHLSGGFSSMKGNLAVCASGFRNRAWVLVFKMIIKAGAALRMTGVSIGYCFCRLMNEDATKTTTWLSCSSRSRETVSRDVGVADAANSSNSWGEI